MSCLHQIYQTYYITTDPSSVSLEEGPVFSRQLWPPDVCCTSPSAVKETLFVPATHRNPAGSNSNSKFVFEATCGYTPGSRQILCILCIFRSILFLCILPYCSGIITRFIIMSTGLTLCGFILSSIFFTCSNVGLIVKLWDQHLLISCTSYSREENKSSVSSLLNMMHMMYETQLEGCDYYY